MTWYNSGRHLNWPTSFSRMENDPVTRKPRSKRLFALLNLHLSPHCQSWSWRLHSAFFPVSLAFQVSMVSVRLVQVVLAVFLIWRTPKCRLKSNKNNSLEVVLILLRKILAKINFEKTRQMKKKIENGVKNFRLLSRNLQISLQSLDFRDKDQLISPCGCYIVQKTL